jgi:hypothetical protein
MGLDSSTALLVPTEGVPAIANRDLVQLTRCPGEVHAACGPTGHRLRPYGARAPRSLRPSYGLRAAISAKVEVKARLGGLQRSKIDSPPIMYTQNGDALSLLGNITEKGSRSGSSAISREPQNELVATRVSLTSEILFSYVSQYR